jgi:hypothetical protein
VTEEHFSSLDCLRLKGQTVPGHHPQCRRSRHFSMSNVQCMSPAANPELIPSSTGQGRWTSGQSGRRPTHWLGTRHGEVPKARRRVFSLDAWKWAGWTGCRSGCVERYRRQSPINSGAQEECRLDRVENVSGIGGKAWGNVRSIITRSSARLPLSIDDKCNGQSLERFLGTRACDFLIPSIVECSHVCSLNPLVIIKNCLVCATVDDGLPRRAS